MPVDKYPITELALTSMSRNAKRDSQTIHVRGDNAPLSHSHEQLILNCLVGTRPQIPIEKVSAKIV